MFGLERARQIDARTRMVDETAMAPTFDDTRPDPSSEQRAAERAADRIGLRALLGRLGWSDDDLSRAAAFGFPKSGGRVIDPTTRGLGESWWRWSEVRAWASALRAMAALLPQTWR